MSNSTKEESENGVHFGQNIENPHAHLELTEEELVEIYSRPWMNPNHAKFGCDPESNKNRDIEIAMMQAKQEKCQELIR
jgi:hypothetical protein